MNDPRTPIQIVTLLSFVFSLAILVAIVIKMKKACHRVIAPGTYLLVGISYYVMWFAKQAYGPDFLQGIHFGTLSAIVRLIGALLLSFVMIYVWRYHRAL